MLLNKYILIKYLIYFYLIIPKMNTLIIINFYTILLILIHNDIFNLQYKHFLN
jgi:hypothetical protein